jgi:hypothetical protein
VQVDGPGIRDDALLPFDNRGINFGHNDDLGPFWYSANDGESFYKGGEWTTSSPKRLLLKTESKSVTKN